MASDLLKIGAQCSLPSCGLVDFLPVVCPECNSSFCSDHLSLQLHKCPALESHLLPVSVDSKPLRRCDFADCKKPSLRVGNGPETCISCQRSFCVDHRHLDQHICPSLVADDTKTSKSRISSSLPRPKFQLRARKPPTDPVRLVQWQKMELMRMRHRAVPGDPRDKMTSPPPEQRLHVRLFVGEAQTEKVFWLRKSVVTGRALDLLVSQLNLTFDGNPVGNLLLNDGAFDEFSVQELSLYKIVSDSEELVNLRNDQLLVDQIDDGTSLVVCPVSNRREELISRK